MINNNLSTADELISNKLSTGKYGKLDMAKLAKEVAIEFAKLHVEAALKEASEEATINKNKGQITAREFGNVLDGSYSINKESILNSYSLDNIK